MTHKHFLSFTLLLTSALFEVLCIIASPLYAGNKLPEHFYKRFEGTVSNMNIVMNLARRDSLLSGSYYNNESGSPVYFSFESRIKSDGSFQLIESSDEQNSRHYGFNGKFINEHEIMGTWQPRSSQSSYYFSLVEKYPAGSAVLEIKALSKNYTSDNNMSAKISFSIPGIISYPNKSIASIINRSIEESLQKEYDTDKLSQAEFNEDMNDFIDRYKAVISDSLPADYKPQWENIFSVDILFNSEYIIAVETTNFRYEGGAHPITLYKYYNYNLNTGKLITLDQLLKEEYKEQLNKIAERRFKEQHNIKLSEKLSKYGYFAESDSFKINNNFSISKNGLIFRFNEYEIGPYVFGAPDVFIPYSDLKYFIKPEGLLSRFVK